MTPESSPSLQATPPHDSTRSQPPETASAPANGPGAHGQPEGSALYLHELDQSVNEAILHAVFAPVASKITSIRVGRDQARQKSLGYAFVNFRGADDAGEAAETMEPLFIQNALCRMAPFRDKASFTKPQRLNPSQSDGVFIKNLHPDVTAPDLYETFSKFGPITACRIALNEYGQSRGFAYVTYAGDAQSPNGSTNEKDDSVERAINAMNNTIFHGGRKLFVGRNLPRQVRIGRFGEEPAEEEFRNLFVKGVDQTVSEQTFYELFSSVGPLETYTLPLDDIGANRGYGFVRYREHADAARAITELQGHILQGRGLSVSRAQRRPPESKSPQPGAQSPANLYIRCFDQSVTDGMLETEFARFGPIVSAKVIQDERGVSRCYGFVCFERAQDAEAAIRDMNNKHVWGQNLYVARAQRRDRRSSIPIGTGNRVLPSAGMVALGGTGVPGTSASASAAAYYYVPYPYYPPPYAYYPQPGPSSSSGGTSRPTSPEPVPAQGLLLRQRGYGSSLAAAVASAADEEAAKRVIGEALYPKVLAHGSVAGDKALASQITGILLEQDKNELLQWVDADSILNRRIQQACNAYLDYQARQTQKTR